MTAAIPLNKTHMQVEIIDKSREQAWDRMVEEHPFGCVFHTSAFKRVISETFSHTVPYYLALVDEGGNMHGGMALFLVRSWLTGTRLVSLPFAFYSDPLVQSTDEFMEVFRATMDVFREHKADYLEIKAWHSTPLLERAGILTASYDHKTYSVDLTNGLNELWARLHKDCIQRKIQRAEKRGIEIRSATSEDDILLFWRLLVQTRRRLGLPPQRYDYWRNLWKHLAPSRLMDVLLAEMAGTVIGAISLFRSKGVIHLGYVANQAEYWGLGVDQALLWKAIQIGVNNGCHVFDLGKVSRFAESLMTYKKRWGAQATEAPSFYYPCRRGVSALNDERRLSHRMITRMWRTLPRPLSTMAGRFAFRHLG